MKKYHDKSSATNPRRPGHPVRPGIDGPAHEALARRAWPTIAAYCRSREGAAAAVCFFASDDKGFLSAICAESLALNTDAVTQVVALPRHVAREAMKISFGGQWSERLAVPPHPGTIDVLVYTADRACMLRMDAPKAPTLATGGAN